MSAAAMSRHEQIQHHYVHGTGNGEAELPVNFLVRFFEQTDLDNRVIYKYNVVDTLLTPDNYTSYYLDILDKLNAYEKTVPFLLQCFTTKDAVIIKSDMSALIILKGKVATVYSSREQSYESVIATSKNNKQYLQWYYKTSGYIDHTKVMLGKNAFEVRDNFYPYIKEGLDSYLSAFKNSTSNVIIFMGEPGTGKTSLVKHFINRFGSEAMATYDEEVMNSDEFFLDFMVSETADLMILEDADIILKDRAIEKNTIMNKLLNVSNGLVSLSNKKIIFTTNLKTTKEIDPAIMRPGRCFDVLECKPLTLDQANAICNDKGLEPLEPETTRDQEYTLSEVFNRRKLSTEQKRVGFVK